MAYFMFACSDHAGGNAEMMLKFPESEIFGYDQRIVGLTHALKDQEKFDVLCTHVHWLDFKYVY